MLTLLHLLSAVALLIWGTNIIRTGIQSRTGQLGRVAIDLGLVLVALERMLNSWCKVIHGEQRQEKSCVSWMMMLIRFISVSGSCQRKP